MSRSRSHKRRLVLPKQLLRAVQSREHRPALHMVRYVFLKFLLLFCSSNQTCASENKQIIASALNLADFKSLAVGCACPTSTVTDYVVSCSGTGSLKCKTVSTTAITGCYVTGTAVTTGAYCVTGYSLYVSDQGNSASGTATQTVVYTTATLPECKS